MATTPKQILDTAVRLGRGVITRGRDLVRRDAPPAPPSGAPPTVGAAKPGAARGPKSATAPAARPKAEPAAASRKPGSADIPS
jgi:hypothetical protein